MHLRTLPGELLEETLKWPRFGIRILSDSRKKKKVVGERLWEVKCEAEFGILGGEAEKRWAGER